MSAGAAAPSSWRRCSTDQAQPDLRLKDRDLRPQAGSGQVRRTFKHGFGMTFQAYQRLPPRDGDEGAHGGAGHRRAWAGFNPQRFQRRVRARFRRHARARARHGATATWIEPAPGPCWPSRAARPRSCSGSSSPRWGRLRGARVDSPGRAPRSSWNIPPHGLRHSSASKLAGTRRDFDLPLKQRGSAFSSPRGRRSADPLARPGHQTWPAASDPRRPRHQPRQRPEPDRHRRPLPPRDPRGRVALRLRRRQVAEAVAARSRTRGRGGPVIPPRPAERVQRL